MFFQPSEEQQQPAKSLQNNYRRRRKKRNSYKKKQKQSTIAVTMSSWADDFITAATWQMKHQIAYWKSKARALQYENKILHEIIKNNTTCISSCNPETDISVNSDCNKPNEEEFEEDDNFEVSEEFIQFLKTNAKYKEDAKKERERLKAKLQEDTNNTMDGPSERTEDSIDDLKELYGKDWQRVQALEMSLQCEFIEQCDKYKPMHWPNIPLNFNI